MKEPVIHNTRNEAQRVRFTKEHVMIDLADGRILGVPLDFFPLLKAATIEERENYQLHGLTIYWEDIDDGMDITALVSGLYIEPSANYLESLKEIIAERKAKAATPT
ncbi:MAG: DUF2442 domain-containing protein [Chloroflexota bacterium]|nr:DUF2442 domain-containing protein [Chloroflexota bacterium]MDE2908431.1 DUF2442 domain-containing protein [Chloroflexota bacterium]